MCSILDIRSKYVIAAEPLIGAYNILYCFARSSKDSTGVSRRDTVRNAARLAVYDAIIINLYYSIKNNKN